MWRATEPVCDETEIELDLCNKEDEIANYKKDNTSLQSNEPSSAVEETKLLESNDTTIEMSTQDTPAEWILHFYSDNRDLLGSLSLPQDLLKISDKNSISDLKVIPLTSDATSNDQSSPSTKYLLQYYDHSSGLHKGVELPNAITQTIPANYTSLSVVVESVSTTSSIFEKYLTLISFCFLIIAMLAIASGGVAFKLLPSDVKYRPLLACLWRTEATILCIIPPTIYQLFKMKDKSVLKEWSTWSKIIVAGLCVSIWTGTFAVALNYTSLTRVYLLNNCQPLLIVVWNKITRKPVNMMHVIGVSLGFIGLGLTCVSGTGEQMDFSKSEIIGDVIAFAGSVAAAVYISLGSEVRAKVPSFIYLMPVSIVSFIIYTVCTLTMEDSPVSMLFSWYKPTYLPVIAWLAVVTGLLGISVIAIVMKHLPSLLISIVLLAEPVVASVLAIIFKVEETPGWLTWVGAVLVTFGVMFVSLGFGGKAVLSCWHKRAKCLRMKAIKSPKYEMVVDSES